MKKSNESESKLNIAPESTEEYDACFDSDQKSVDAAGLNLSNLNADDKEILQDSNIGVDIPTVSLNDESYSFRHHDDLTDRVVLTRINLEDKEIFDENHILLGFWEGSFNMKSNGGSISKDET